MTCRTTYPMLIALITLSLAGCGIIVRESIDTQPRVGLAQSTFDTPQSIVHGRVIAYLPEASGSWPACDPDLVAYAPILMQGAPDKDLPNSYDASSDAIGTPRLATGGECVRVDTDNPALYARIERTEFDGVSLKQLTYVFWYPARPIGSVETGSVDGGILRITLDVAGRPMIFEYSQPCGCFHGVFASAEAESLALVEFGRPAESRIHCIEPPPDRSDWIVRAIVPAAVGQRPVLYLSAGKHFCEALRFVDRDADLHADQKLTYQLAPYDSLNAIACDDQQGEKSMFNEHGLVRGGRRWKEELLFSDMDHPGWPRHLDRMRIHWDHDAWNDPNLLEHNLRLPHAMATELSLRGTADMQSTPGDRATNPSLTTVSEQPVVLYIMNRACSGCKFVHDNLLPKPRVQAALNGIELRTYDTATPEGAAMASKHRIDVTPTMLGFDRHGRLVFQSDDVLEESKIVELLKSLPRED